MRVRAIRFAAILVLGAIACSRVADRPDDALVVAFEGAAGTLNPAVDTPAWRLVFLPLLVQDERGELAGRLARSWERSEDRAWTFHLRTDFQWEDGVPVTSRDVAFAVRVLAHPAVAYYGPEDVRVVAVPDDSTITIRTWMNFMIDEVGALPAHLLGELDPARVMEWDFWTRPVGNGPYRVVRYVPETMMEFEASPSYRGEPPRIRRVILTFDRNAGLAALLSGRADAIHDAAPGDVARAWGDPRFRIYHEVYSYDWGIYWNTGREPFSDPRVRLALSHAIDRRELLRVQRLPDSLPLSEGFRTGRQEKRGDILPPIPHDPPRGRVLLDAAGWRDEDGDGLRERDRRTLGFTLLVRGKAGAEDTAVLVQEHLRRVGARVEIQTLESEVLWERMRSGSFDAALTSHGTYIEMFHGG